jgi:hypothetical protein
MSRFIEGTPTPRVDKQTELANQSIDLSPLASRAPGASALTAGIFYVCTGSQHAASSGLQNSAEYLSSRNPEIDPISSSSNNKTASDHHCIRVRAVIDIQAVTD